MSIFRTSSPLFDLEINCKDGKLYFSKFILSMYSPVFYTMFTSAFKEGMSNSINMDFDMNVVNWLLVLLSMYTSEDIINFFPSHIDVEKRDNEDLTLADISALEQVLACVDMYQLDSVKMKNRLDALLYNEHNPKVMAAIINLMWRHQLHSKVDYLQEYEDKVDVGDLSVEVLCSYYIHQKSNDELYELINIWIANEKNLDELPTLIEYLLQHQVFNQEFPNLVMKCKDKDLQVRALKSFIDLYL